MSVVLDASAILAFLEDGDGADLVREALGDDPRCGAANWSEVAQRILAGGYDRPLARALPFGYGVEAAPVEAGDAEWAARRRRRGEGSSLADRLCPAHGERLDADVLTADGKWGWSGRVKQIR